VGPQDSRGSVYDRCGGYKSVLVYKLKKSCCKQPFFLPVYVLLSCTVSTAVVDESANESFTAPEMKYQSAESALMASHCVQRSATVYLVSHSDITISTA